MNGADRGHQVVHCGAVAGVVAHSEAGWAARLVPFMVDGLICASSMVTRDSVRRKMPVPDLARWLLGVGMAATLAANITHGLGQGIGTADPWAVPGLGGTGTGRGVGAQWPKKTRADWP